MSTANLDAKRYAMQFLEFAEKGLVVGPWPEALFKILAEEGGSVTTLVSDAVAVMDRAGKVIDDLMAVNARLRHENFVMLEALEKIDELYSTQYPNAHMPEVSPYGLIPNVDGVGKAIGMVREAIRLAKGESQ